MAEEVEEYDDNIVVDSNHDNEYYVKGYIMKALKDKKFLKQFRKRLGIGDWEDRIISLEQKVATLTTKVDELETKMLATQTSIF